MKITLVRHAQSISNAGLPADDYAQVPLTDLGRDQAGRLARVFADRPDLVIVSPFLRARATAAPLLARWPGLASETWPIQELTYLSPSACAGTTREDRRAWAEDFWWRADPAWRHAADAESFAQFVERLRAFDEALSADAGRSLIVFGHGQFLRAYMLGLDIGFAATAAWMRRFRAAETSDPLANAERVVIARGRVAARLRLDGAPA